MTIPNYLALYNLSQIDADILIVSDLTATTGTIYTLNSTTGTITTLNTTTANITTLFTNLWRGTSPSSTMIMGDTITSGNIRIGNYTTPADQTGSIFLYGNTFITGNKSLFISNGDFSLASSTGIITGNILRGVGIANNISLYSTTTGSITLGGASSGIILADNTTISNTLLCNTLTGTTTGSAISLFGTSTALIDLGNASSISVIRLNQNTSLAVGKILRTPYLYPISTVADLYVGNQASDSGILYIELNTDLHSSRKLKLNNTTASKLLLTNASKEIISSSYTDTDFARLTANNSFSGSNTFNAITQNNLYDFKQGVAGGIYSNFHTGTSASQDLYFGEDLDTGVIISLRTFTMGIPGGEKLLKCNKFEYVGFDTDSITFYPTHIGNITIGHATASTDVGTLFIQKNTTIASNKNILLQGTGKITTPSILVSGLTASKLVLTDASKNLVSSLYTDSDFARLTATNTFSGTSNTFSNTLLCNTFTGLTAGGNISLFSTTTGTCAFGNTGGGDLTINPSVVLASNKNLTLQGTGGITLSTGTITGNTFQGTTAGSNISLFSTTTGTITIGTTSNASTFNGDVYVGTSVSNKGIVCNYLSTYATSGTMRISPIFTTGSIQIGDSQTTGSITIGHTTPASDSGTLTINKTTTLAANKNLTLGSQSKLVGGANGSVNITAVSYTNIAVIASASLAGFYQVFIYGASATQTYSVCCFLSADNSGAIQTTASRNMTFQFSSPNYTITATVAPTSTISMGYNIVRLF